MSQLPTPSCSDQILLKEKIVTTTITVSGDWMRLTRIVVIVGLALVLQPVLKATYSIPSARTITWAGKAGLDPVGGIPSAGWATVPCNVIADGVTNQVSQINSCISGAVANRVVKLPCGAIVANGTISMKSNVALRGCAPLRYPTTVLPAADAAVTTLVLNGNQVLFNGGSKTANWTPYGANSGIAVSSGYTKDSTQLTVANTTGLTVNGWISLYQNEDTSLMSWRGINYLGEDCGCSTPHAWQQYTKITAMNGNVLTIDPPVYQVSPSPTGVAVRPQSFGVQMAGLEDVRLQGNNTGTLVRFNFTAYVWLKGIETYGGGDNSGENHILGTFSHNVEIRDSIVHDGGSFNSGANYGIGSYWWNSAYKIENNEIYHTRHSIIFEAGMSGAFIGYNYSHDNAEGEDFSFLSEDCTPNHGANPMMNLWEGNWCQQFYSDYTQGSASYNTLFRNYGYGTRTEFHPASGMPFRIGPFSRDYNLVGNVSGRSSWTSGTAVCNSASCSGNIAYEFGVHTDGSYLDSQSRSTALLQGNYDYVTDGVAVWDNSDHSLPASLYYGSKPAFLGSCAWPAFGPDVPTQIQTLPAKERATGGAGCSGPSAPTAPANLRIQP
jgi:hypothetical protein